MDGRFLRFGIFLAPFHALDENPTLALERDLELLEHLDALDYHEAWIGEHHSGGFEIIASPEIFIAAAAQRTQRIKLGTGVVSLPYHHPLMVADRMLQLDHMTRGRAMFGVGPGALTADAYKMGIPIPEQRRMMNEAIDVLVSLLRGETVSAKTDWFELNDARLQIEPYSKPMMDMTVASARSPVGARAAGKHGLGLLSIGGTTDSALAAHAANWQICEEIAREHGHEADRSKWRVVSMMHVAETRAQARKDLEFGLERWLEYFQEVTTFPVVPSGVPDSIDYLIENGIASIGTPDDAIEAIERLWEGSDGGFGAHMLFAHNWADWAETKRSYELIARYVMPHFQSKSAARRESYDFSATKHELLSGQAREAVQTEIEKHAAERAAKADSSAG
jgi:limonene 1,2-monooxygenase